MDYTLPSGKKVQIPNSEILAMRQKLKCSSEEATKVWLFDHDFITDETADKLTAKAKESRITATIHQARRERNSEPKKQRLPKSDPKKEEIITFIAEKLSAIVENVQITNSTKIVEFDCANEHYKLDLIRQRKPKN